MRLVAGILVGLYIALAAAAVIAIGTTTQPGIKTLVFSLFAWGLSIWYAFQSKETSKAWRRLLLTGSIMSFTLAVATCIVVGRYMIRTSSGDKAHAIDKAAGFIETVAYGALRLVMGTILLIIALWRYPRADMSMPLALRMAIGVNAGIFFFSQIPRFTNFDWVPPAVATHLGSAVPLIMLIAVVTLQFGTLYMVAKGRNWARYVLALWWFLALVAYWTALYQQGITSYWDNILSCILLIAQTFSIALLFRERSTLWFAK